MEKVDKDQSWKNHLGETVTFKDVETITQRVMKLSAHNINKFFIEWWDDPQVKKRAFSDEKLSRIKNEHKYAYSKIDVYQFECSIEKAKTILSKLENSK